MQRCERVLLQDLQRPLHVRTTPRTLGLNLDPAGGQLQQDRLSVRGRGQSDVHQEQ